MVLALDYLQRTKQIDPVLEDRFYDEIDQGYQLMTKYEIPREPGSFDWWGKGPSDLYLTALGLMQFLDMKAVYPVAEALLDRIRAHLEGKQLGDGSWTFKRKQPVPLTATVAWALARAGAPNANAVRWLEAKAESLDDPYEMALVALALFEVDPESAAARRLVARLASQPTWDTTSETAIGGRGRSARIESTALAVLALVKDGRHPRLVQEGIERILRRRDDRGRFGTTRSTIAALRALLATHEEGPDWSTTRVHVRDGDETVASRPLTRASSEPEHVELGPTAPTVVALDEDALVRAVLTRRTWRPWDSNETSRGRLALDVVWPTQALEIGRRAQAVVTLRNRSEKRASMATVEIGIPPGCTVRAEDVRGDRAARVERGATRVVIYVTKLEPGEARVFTIPFTPRYELDVRTAPSKGYEYYVPEAAIHVEPQRVWTVPAR